MRLFSRTRLLSLTLAGSLSLSAATTPREDFQSPPFDAKPWTFWFWINGNVTKEGIRADLEDMKRVGIGGAMLFDAALYLPKGPIRYGSDEWHDYMRYAFETAGELGLKISVMNCAGWATSGGPWNTVEQSMKMVVWSETEINGGRTWSGRLPQPPSKLDFYRDVAVLAMPEPDQTGPAPTANSSRLVEGLAQLLDGDFDTHTTFEAAEKHPAITLTYPASTPRSSVSIDYFRPHRHQSHEGVPSDDEWLPGGVIESSEDGRSFRELQRFAESRQEFGSRQEIRFPLTSARYFRITFQRTGGRQALPFHIAELRVTDIPRITDLAEKTGLKPQMTAVPNGQDDLAAAKAIAGTRPIDLTAKLGANGELSWTPPPGRWTLLRIGYTTTARTNHPAPPEGEGLEVDKFDSEAVTSHLKNGLGKLLQDNRSVKHPSLSALHADSWEAGPQNWTAALPAEFKQRRGYDITPWLPCLTGRIVGSIAESEAFLNDFRTTLGDLYAEEHFGTFKRFARENGLELVSESYGGALDEFKINQYVDSPAVEFWAHDLYKGFVTTTSAAHTMGKKVVMAEAFTSRPPLGQWRELPSEMKTLGDGAYAAGVNRMVLHSYIHQPRSDFAPGFTHGRYGSHFGRLNSWWSLAPAWVDYLTRTQALLQRGRPVADILALYPERLQSEQRNLDQPAPKGYQSDLLAPFQLASVKVENGMLILPSGQSYQVLLMPDRWTTSLDTLQQLARLKRAGAKFLGPAPFAPQGLLDLTTSLADWNELVAEIWPANENSAPLPKEQLAAKLVVAGVPLDFGVESRDVPEPDVRFFHRRDGKTDIYFVTNQTRTAFTATLKFRTTDRVPELWDPVNGTTKTASSWRIEGAHTLVDLTFADGDSIFVVFEKPAPERWPVAITHAGQPFADSLGLPNLPVGDYAIKWSDGKTETRTIAAVAPASEIQGTWQVAFQPNRGAPPSIALEQLASLSEHRNPGVRYFAGSANYQIKFNVTAGSLKRGERQILDLGSVHDLAQVTLNGHAFPAQWRPPFRLAVTDHLKVGENTLSITIANRWTNRLIGDEALPADMIYDTGAEASRRDALLELPEWWRNPQVKRTSGRVAFATWKHYTKDMLLLRSGLVGPVKLETQAAFPQFEP